MNVLVETERLIITEMTMDMAMDIHKNSLDEDTRRFVPDEVFETLEDAKAAGAKRAMPLALSVPVHCRIQSPAADEMLLTVHMWYANKSCPGDWLYQRSGSIWVPSLFHGAFNAVGTLPLMITVPDTGTARLLGSAPVGLLAGLPIVIFAVVLLLKCKKNAE